MDTIDAATVAQLLGVSPRQVNNYINTKGLPSQGEGKRRTFKWDEVREWFVAYRFSTDRAYGSDGSDDGDSDDETSGSGKKEDQRKANLRKTKAEANLKELQLSKLRGEVVTITDARLRLDRMMGNLRAKLLGMAPKLASRLESERERTGREAAIKEELEQLCREISTGAVVDLPADETEIPELNAAAEPAYTFDDLVAIEQLLVEAYAASSSEGLAAFDRILADACALMRPPEHLTVAEWADKYGMLSSEGSARPGKFFVSTAEYQRAPMEALSDPRLQTVALMWASQVGKTQIGLLWVGYIGDHDPGPILFIEPTEDLAKVIVKDRIDPMIRDTPVLTRLFGQGGRGKGGGDTFHKSFPGGQLSMGWANSPTQLASRPIRYLVTDEEGRYGANMEGDPVDQARKRMATFPNRKHLRVSSPNLRRTCRITRAYEQSDQRLYFVPCPHCGHLQTLRWEQLRGTPDDCFYMCEASACVITEDDKYAMIRAGEWRAQNPGGGDGKTAGFQLSAMYSTIGYTWAEMLEDFRKCEGIPDKLQVFTNTFLAEPWDEQAEGADLNAVARHAEEYPAQAPDWVLMVTCGADVQKDRIEATKWGWGLNNQSGVIEHKIFRGDPLKTDVWTQFEYWRAQKIEHETGLFLPNVCTFVDSGDGNRTDSVYSYVRGKESRGVFACKGSSLNGAPLVNRGNRVGKYKVLVVSVGTSTAKDAIYGRLQIEDKTRPGYIHFPSNPESGCDADYFKHLTAERLVTRQTKGGEVSRWENPNKRNEALDTAVYAMAAKEFTRANLPELERKLRAKVLATNPTPPAARRQAEDVAAVGAYLGKPAAKELAKPRQNPVKVGNSGRKRKRIPGFGWVHG